MRDSTWVVIDTGDTWEVRPQDGGSATDLSTIGLYVISLGLVEGSSVINEGAIDSFVLGGIS